MSCNPRNKPLATVSQRKLLPAHCCRLLLSCHSIERETRLVAIPAENRGSVVLPCRHRGTKAASAHQHIRSTACAIRECRHRKIQNLMNGGNIQQREQQMLDRHELVVMVPRSLKRLIQTKFKLTTQHNIEISRIYDSSMVHSNGCWC